MRFYYLPRAAADAGTIVVIVIVVGHYHGRHSDAHLGRFLVHGVQLRRQLLNLGLLQPPAVPAALAFADHLQFELATRVRPA